MGTRLFSLQLENLGWTFPDFSSSSHYQRNLNHLYRHAEWKVTRHVRQLSFGSCPFDAQITGLPSDTLAHFEMPQGGNWLVNKPTVAKYVNKDAPTGGGVKVSVLKPMKLIKMVGKSLGDFANDGGHNIIEPAIFGKPKIAICGLPVWSLVNRTLKRHRSRSMQKSFLKALMESKRSSG